VRTKIHDHRRSTKEIDRAQGRSMVLEHIRDQRLDNSGGARRSQGDQQGVDVAIDAMVTGLGAIAHIAVTWVTQRPNGSTHPDPAF
jgi:adhesin HecA-like repeat protein